MTKYKAHLKKDIFVTISSVIFIAAAIFFSSELSRTSWLIIVIFLTAILLINVFSNRILEIQLDGLNRRLTLIYGNYLKGTKTKDFDLQKIEYTYKRQATSLRSGARNVCSLYYEDKRLARLIPRNDGWTNEEIEIFVKKLIQLEVPRKFIGFSLKDVET